MENYDPSLRGVLRDRMCSAVRSVREILPVWNPSGKPMDHWKSKAPRPVPDLIIANQETHAPNRLAFTEVEQAM